jgi:hypothetical protein
MGAKTYQKAAMLRINNALLKKLKMGERFLMHLYEI